MIDQHYVTIWTFHAVQVKNLIESNIFLNEDNVIEANKYRRNALEFVSDRRETLNNYLREIGRCLQ